MEENMAQPNHNISTFAPGFLEYLSDGVVVLDKQQQIVTVNKAATHILGWAKAELVGQLWPELLHEQPSLISQPLNEAAYGSQVVWPPSNSKGGEQTTDLTLVYQSELTINCKNGSQCEVSASSSPLYLNSLTTPVATSNGSQTLKAEQPLYSLIILRDITEQKRLERIKTQFVVTAAHQLRTPLAAIKHSIGLLLDHMPPTLAPPLGRLLQNIQSSSLQMERLVNDLVELANLQSGLVQLGEGLVEVSRVMQQAVAANQEKLQQKAQPLELVLPTTPLFVNGDNARLTQILSHLLSNASKFSLPGSPIKLTAIVTNQFSSSEVTFSVTDQGRGISPEEQQLIFEKFYQSEVSENADGSGVGIGLPLTKALVELHGGRLWLESTPGQGSTFYFGLPLVQLDTAHQVQALAVGNFNNEDFNN